MHSIRTRAAMLAVFALIVGMTVATLLGVSAIRDIGNSSSEQLLLLLCETGEKNLDAYFESVEQSVEIEVSFAEADIDGLEPDKLAAHVERASQIFERTAYKTNGVLTYYYRIDPSISNEIKGFWYTNLDGNGFVEHEVTDITQYDTSDTSQLVWFTVPKNTGKPVWQPPYITDNLDVRVISYNYPIYYEGTFVGVVGIEIDYSTMAKIVDSIQLYEHGYAFINDAEGNIIYHPHMDVEEIAENPPKVPEGLLSEDKFIEYNFEGVEKEAVWLPLSNGMRLNVTVPTSEINGNWEKLLVETLIVSVILLLIFILFATKLSGNITKPLKKLVVAAQKVDAGDYDVNIEVDTDDEIAVLANTFNQLTSHLKIYIDDLNDLAYADALTSLHNKGAFDIYIKELQQQLDNDEEVEFAIGIFDCDDLKGINDTYGHEKGDIYLKTASHLMCRVFSHSPMFRIGGDEFAAIIQGEDYENREELLKHFNEESATLSAKTDNEWEKVRVAVGIGVYDSKNDATANDVVRKADKLMYEDKRDNKPTRKTR